MAINNDNNNDQRWSRFIYPSISPTTTTAAAATNIDSVNVLEKSSSFNKHQKQLIIIFDNNSSIENLNWKSKLNETIQYLIENDNHHVTLSVAIESFPSTNEVENDGDSGGGGLSHECTMIITIMASVCLLLFSALTFLLIVMKRNKSYGLQYKLQRQQQRQKCRSLSVPNFSRYVPANLRCPSCSSSLKPRKSSLKPPTDSFRIKNDNEKPLVATISRSNTEPNIKFKLSNDDDDTKIDMKEFRRKSIVTFNEATLIR
ncbi:hypothetical protein DERF_012607 [Dermatophagoides farinae]|uniref:Uncharacterized protein n=1 Tax=Dermatophagoides farinae TaxID=6954 RepID=A0A922HS79_DERFA|nr:uncharacterized protein LOC124496708 [Dermatophagoides farinae]KAH9501793.1 hypothetical protein DERF_012607 [Dermatophagoides farinae]